MYVFRTRDKRRQGRYPRKLKVALSNRERLDGFAQLDLNLSIGRRGARKKIVKCFRWVFVLGNVYFHANFKCRLKSFEIVYMYLMSVVGQFDGVINTFRLKSKKYMSAFT